MLLEHTSLNIGSAIETSTLRSFFRVHLFQNVDLFGWNTNRMAKCMIDASLSFCVE